MRDISIALCDIYAHNLLLCFSNHAGLKMAFMSFFQFWLHNLFSFEIRVRFGQNLSSVREGVVRMNVGKQELFDRLMKALSSISQNPKTATEVNRILEDFVISLEEIVDDLKATSDEQTAAALRMIIHASDRNSLEGLAAV